MVRTLVVLGTLVTMAATPAVGQPGSPVYGQVGVLAARHAPGNIGSQVSVVPAVGARWIRRSPADQSYFIGAGQYLVQAGLALRFGSATGLRAP